ncbi:MAG: penicillin acylase family protein [Myxococcaceae bacterium]|nr:penicillin acylase family protein [Myxococcaceae bacterium]
MLLPLSLTGCAATSLVSYRLAPDYPKAANETVTLPGISDPSGVRIFYDPLGVPHIEASNVDDLLCAVGYAQGRDRFFEMDMMRRFARGRVSELVGEQPLFSGTTVDFDRSMRGWGLGERAEQIVAGLPADERTKLGRFAACVNAAVDAHRPLEYRLLQVDPQPWTPEDTWVVGLLNAWTVSHNWQQELARFTLALSVGVDRAEAIYPSEPLGGSRTLPGMAPRRELLPSVAPELRTYLESLPGPVRAPALAVDQARAGTALLALAGASNAWVISGARSRSGKPMLANDPHLSHLLPSIVYQQHLKAPGLDVIGVAIPGLPWVVMGHNDRVAWGITSTVADVMDLVVERPDPARPGFVLHEGGDCPLVTREAVIAAKDAPPRTITLRSTCNGPLLNDMLPDLLPEGAPWVAVRWLSNGVERSLSALERADRARSVAELREVAADLNSPIQTFTAADVDGHIGTFMSGTVPVRRAHRGTFPIPGWVAAYEWSGVVPRELTPAGFDPPSGFFAHANNLMVDPRETEAPINVDAAPPFRFDRIVERLKAVPKHDLDTLEDIQTDVKLLRAAQVLPRMLEDLKDFSPRDDRDRAALDLLRRWNYQATTGSPAAAIFFMTYRNAVLAAVSDELAPAPLHFFMSQRYSTNVADGWLERVDHPIWDRRDTPERETRTDQVRAAFLQAVDTLSARLGGEPVTWRWGKIHDLQPKHPFGGKAALASLVNLEPTEAGGALDSIWKSHFEMGDDAHPFRAMAGPVYRMVVDLGDLAHGRWIIDTGASGWPGSPHYGDQFPLWAVGHLAPMIQDWGEVARSAEAVLELRPAATDERAPRTLRATAARR